MKYGTIYVSFSSIWSLNSNSDKIEIIEVVKKARKLPFDIVEDSNESYLKKKLAMLFLKLF